MAKVKKSVIEIVNQKIIEKLESGVNPWIKGWVTAGGVRTNQPKNYISNKAYTGINNVLLDAGYYLTFKQIQDLGGKVKAGAKGNMVIFTKQLKKEEKKQDGTTEEKYSFMLRYYHVFNLSDTTGCREIKHREKAEEVEYNEKMESIESIESVLNNYINNNKITYHEMEQDKAFYNPSLDKVVLPLKKQFNNINAYYSTKFHELAHSTGHKKRLNRLSEIANFGSQSYSKEELIAEITSAYLLTNFNIDTEATINNNVSYLKGWASHLKGNTTNYFIMSATTEANKAYKMILDKKAEAEEV